MKKIITGILTAALCLSVAVPVFAKEIDQDSDPKEGTTTLTTSKEATYMVIIPQLANITFDTEVNPIGDIEYRSGNLEPDAYVTVTLEEQAPLVNTVNEDYTIPYEVKCGDDIFQKVIYDEDTAAGTKTPLTVNITSEAWEAAKSGSYTGSLIFVIDYTNPHAAEDESDNAEEPDVFAEPAEP